MDYQQQRGWFNITRLISCLPYLSYFFYFSYFSYHSYPAYLAYPAYSAYPAYNKKTSVECYVANGRGKLY